MHFLIREVPLYGRRSVERWVPRSWGRCCGQASPPAHAAASQSPGPRSAPRLQPSAFSGRKYEGWYQIIRVRIVCNSNPQRIRDETHEITGYVSNGRACSCRVSVHGFCLHRTNISGLVSFVISILIRFFRTLHERSHDPVAMYVFIIGSPGLRLMVEGLLGVWDWG